MYERWSPNSTNFGLRIPQVGEIWRYTHWCRNNIYKHFQKAMHIFAVHEVVFASHFRNVNLRVQALFEFNMSPLRNL